MRSAIRRFLRAVSSVAALGILVSPGRTLAGSHTPAPKASMPIMDVQMGAPAYYDYGGDSWDPAWALDDDLYSAVNDGAGFGTLKQNIAFNRISGSDPLRSDGTIAKRHG